MTNKVKYPYQLINAFITNVSFHRESKLPSPLEIPTEIALGYLEPEFPKIQVNLMVRSRPNSHVTFELEVVGIFNYVGGRKEYDKELDKEFIFERAFHMLWLYCSQLLKQLSSQMAMNPINVQLPQNFGPSDSSTPEQKRALPKPKPKKKKAA